MCEPAVETSRCNSPTRSPAELSVRFSDDEVVAKSRCSKDLQDCRFARSVALDSPEPYRESFVSLPPSSLVMAIGNSVPRTAGKTNRNSDGRTVGAEPLRLVTKLLQMVIQELREQIKDGPLHQQGRLEMKQYAEDLKSIAENEFPTSLSCAQFKPMGIPIPPNELNHELAVSRCISKSDKLCLLVPPIPISPSSSAIVSRGFGGSPVSPAQTLNDASPMRTISGMSQQSKIPELRRSGTGMSQWTNALVNVFHDLDVDGDGTMSKEELRAALQAVNVPAARAQKMLNAADVDGSGEIDLAEWKAAVSRGGDEEMRRVSHQLLNAISINGNLNNLKDSNHEPSPSCMLRPDSLRRLTWDVGLTFLCVYVAFVLPFTNGFDEWIDPEVSKSLFRIELLIDLVFLLDVCLNFRTGIMKKDGTLILDGRRVARRYFSSWFVLDLVSSIPLAQVSARQLTSVRVLKLLKIPKIVRALRVIKQILLAQSELVTLLDEALSSPVLRAVSRRSIMFFLTILLCHWLACLMAFTSNIWLIEYIRGKDYKPSLWRAYLVAVYWAMTTMTTVGYGDITPSTDWERAYTVIAMVIGGAYYGYAVGTIVSIVSNRDLNASAYHDRMDGIYAWLDHHKFSAELRRRIIRYFKGYLTEKAAIDEADVVNELSPALRDEVGKIVLHEDIRTNPIFDNLPMSAVSRLQKIVNKVYIEEGQTVVQDGEVGSAMFIVGTGMVRMEHIDIDGQKRRPRVLCSGDSFGEEILCGLEERYTYTVVAIKKTASLFMIEQDAFEQLFEHMRGVKDQVFKNVVDLRRDASKPSIIVS